MAFSVTKAVLREQATAAMPAWPSGIHLWGVAQPSGLNVHETINALAEKWRAAMAMGV